MATEYRVEVGYDGNGDWEWELGRDGKCDSLEAARSYRKWLDQNVAPAATRIVERTYTDVVVD